MEGGQVKSSRDYKVPVLFVTRKKSTYKFIHLTLNVTYCVCERPALEDNHCTVCDTR